MGKKPVNKITMTSHWQFFCKEKLFYPSLIFVVWLVTYITFTLLFEQKLGWDEVSYLAVAKGIAEDFDFSSRHYTIMGILKYGFPTNLINFPIHSTYLAVLFKLFGTSLLVAYFSTWLAALGVCLLIFYIFLLISEDSKKLAFIASMSYLFCPGILKNCDSAMMEQFGCFLLCLFVFFIIRDLVKGVFNYLTVFKFSLSFLILWLYKSLFIGYFLGAFVLIVLAYNSKIYGKKINSKIPLPLFLFLSYGLFVVLFYIAKEFVFLPVAPMMNFTSDQDANQVYADFLGGFFNDFGKNLPLSLNHFFSKTIASYFVYPSSYNLYYPEIFKLPGYHSFLGIYFLLLFVMAALSFATWSKLSPISRIFIIFTIITIFLFNLVFNVLFISNHSNIWRYNVYYLPVYICSFWLVLKSVYAYVKPFIEEHPRVTKTLLIFFLIFVYLPMFVSTLVQYVNYEEWFHDTAKQNATSIKKALKNQAPKFIYFNDGTHTIYVDYPTRWIFKDATNGQLLKVNEILPEPIEFLFLREGDWLFKINKEQILLGKPILNDKYKFYGVIKEPHTAIYRFDKSIAS